jgi:hypothetical protein
MKHLTTFLIIILTLTSCIDKTKNAIEGDWIGYEKTFVWDTDTITDNFHMVLSISKDSIRAKNFKFITNVNRDSVFMSSYKVTDSIIILTSNSKSIDTLTIDVLNDTVMILSTSQTKYKYSRLLKPIKKPNNIELVSKMYTISDSIQIIDTVEFLDDSTILTYNLRLKRANQIYEWRLRDYLDHKFLIIDSPNIPVFLVTANTEKGFVLMRKPNDLIKYYFNVAEFQKKITRNMLIGEWSGKSNIPDNEVLFKFYSDSLQMNEFTSGEILTGTYSLSLTGTKMFCFHKYASGNIFYEIEKIRNDSIYLKRLTAIKDSFILTRTK